MELKKDMIKLKEKMAHMLDFIEKTVKSINENEIDSAAYIEKLKQNTELQIKSLSKAISEEDLGTILKIMAQNDNALDSEFVGDIEKSLLSGTELLISKMLVDTSYTELADCLENVMKLTKQLGGKENDVKNINSIYGNCFEINKAKALSKYDISKRKISYCIDIPEHASVLQTQNQVFISGGANPVINSVFEYLTIENTLKPLFSMHYPRYYHRMISVTKNNFWAIGGQHGSENLKYCEEYSIAENKWQTLPQMKLSRRYPAAALAGNYVYVIGGCFGDHRIERIDINTKLEWEFVEIISRELDFEGCAIAFPRTQNEIIFFTGEGKDAIGHYFIEEKSIKRYFVTPLKDNYDYNSAVIIENNAYIMGTNGHMHIYHIPTQKIEEIDFKISSQKDAFDCKDSLENTTTQYYSKDSEILSLIFGF